ncbi:MAG: peroxiredoxin [Planctomycetota bacterium]
MLARGDCVEDLSFTDSEGKTYSLDDFRNRSAIVFFFYPRDFSPGCTKEACAFRDHHQEIKDLGAEVFGVSTDSAERHGEFREKHRLSYRLVPDTDGALSKTFGTGRLGGWLGNKRVTFIVAPDGTIIDQFQSELDMVSHVEHAIEVLKHLKEKAK